MPDVTQHDVVTLKEFFLDKLEHMKTALVLQAREYERRLDTLNHEAEQLKDMQSNYLPRERYEIEIRELHKAIDFMAGKASQQSVYFAYFLSFMSIIVSIISIITR